MNREMWAGTECKHGQRAQNLVLHHHYKTSVACIPGQVGEVSLKGSCVGVMGSAGFHQMGSICPQRHDGVKEFSAEKLVKQSESVH